MDSSDNQNEEAMIKKINFQLNNAAKTSSFRLTVSWKKPIVVEKDEIEDGLSQKTFHFWEFADFDGKNQLTQSKSKIFLQVEGCRL